MQAFENKVAAVTGGAAGIGEAAAIHLAQAGAKVVIADVDSEAGRSVEANLRAQGHEALFVEAHVESETQAANIIEQAVSHFGRLDVLVNNAAVRSYLKVTEADDASWERILGINLKGYAFCAKAAIPAMAANGGGAIVNVASVRSLIAGNSTVQYDTTKAAILGLTRSMARDHAPQGIRVNAVGPGPIMTRFHERRAVELGQSEAQYIKKFGADTLLKRPGTPAEIGNAIGFLASSQASFITGTCLFVDGGVTAFGEAG